MFVSKDLTMGQMNALVKKLGGEEAARRVLDSKTEEFVLLERLPVEHKAWRRVTLGCYKNADEYRNALVNQGFKVSKKANQVLNKIAISQKKIEVDVVLFLPDGASLLPRQSLVSHGLHTGLLPCPPEVAFAACLQFEEYLDHEDWFSVATTEAYKIEGESHYFSCRYELDDAYPVNIDVFPDDEENGIPFAFILPKRL